MGRNVEETPMGRNGPSPLACGPVARGAVATPTDAETVAKTRAA